MATRKKNARLAEHKTQVLAKLQQLRLEGQSLNTEDAIHDVAKELKIPRRDVENIYKQDGKFIKKLQQGNEDNAIYALISIIIPKPRRYGRPILKDK